MVIIQQLSQIGFLQTIFWNNKLNIWIMAGLIFLVVWLFLALFKSSIISRLKAMSQKTKTDLDDIVINALDVISWPLYLAIALWSTTLILVLPAWLENIIYYIFLAFSVYYLVRFSERIIEQGAEAIVVRRENKKEATGIISFAAGLIKVSLWVIALVFFLSNIGFDVTSVIAGLGIGGVAIALALQNILGDLFSSLAIYLDKPFKIGDYIMLGDYSGTVKKIGIKTTRIQALQGEEIVVPNNELTGTKIQNFGVMRERRIVYSLGVTYDTPLEKLKKIPEMIQEIIEAQVGTRVDRIHFKSFGDSSLVFEIVYYVSSGVYAVYMDTQQTINLAILEKFNQEKIEMAFPTQTIHLKK